MKMRRWLAGGVSLAGAGTIALGDVIQVPDDFPRIQQAIDAAADGDEVVIAEGTYTGPGNRDLDPGGKAIVIRGLDGPSACIIDAGGTTADPHRVFVFQSGETADTRIEGLTITGGFDYPDGKGGGMRFINGSPTILDCIITGNVAGGECFSGRGGGAYVSGSPVFIDCLFLGNSAVAGCTGVGDAYGGAIYGGSPVLENCTFQENFASGGGVSEAAGGALYCAGPVVTGCSFLGNHAATGGGSDRGGAIYVCVAATLTDCTFTANALPFGFPAGAGGAIYHAGTTLDVTGCDFTLNEAWNHGGAIYHEGTELNVTDSVFTRNEAMNEGGAIFIAAAAGATVTSSLFCDNLPDAIAGSYVDGGGNGFCPSCDAADLDGDGFVGVPDLLALLAAWGPNAGHPADIDGDDVVGTDDFLALLAAWGPCQ